ncbi:VOC family protein [Agrococcus sp. SGAir0287]|uniref:VOC family protein n=1 Tax=Agrococcus sp. SGAir0287 TaxID=2070347 RepID=UPI0020C7E483|nr:VOC family protein [Agrococcus sp. SGAir0287]
MVFVDLPVADLDRATAFYEGLGWRIEPHCADEDAACVVVSDAISLMILRREHFQAFTTKQGAGSATTAQVLVAISQPSREAVAEIAAKALAAGGTEAREAQDHGFMVQHAVQDPDGIVLEFLWMDPRAAEQEPEAFIAEQGYEV